MSDSKPKYPKYMWVILTACVAIVTILGYFFGVKALIIVVILGLIGSYIVDSRG